MTEKHPIKQLEENQKTDVLISEPFLKFLIICFWINIIAYPLLMACQIIFSEIVIVNASQLEQIRLLSLLLIILLYMCILSLSVVFLYAIYFFYKYDKYSKSGVYLLLFNYIYAQIYFYKVIWKQKRELVNSFEHEQVIGNKIFIETEDFDENGDTDANPQSFQ